LSRSTCTGVEKPGFFVGAAVVAVTGTSHALTFAAGSDTRYVWHRACSE
jgi:hypothetical protein